jgi:integrase
MAEAAVRVLPRLGCVRLASGPPSWQVVFPAVVHEPSQMWLRDLATCDVSPASLRSYAYALLRWLRFSHVLGVRWERAERVHVRSLVEFLRTAPNPAHARRSPDRPKLGSVNAITGKPNPTLGYAPRTINHQLTVLHGFYAYALDMELGPLVNPVPEQRASGGRRVLAHENPLEPVRRERRARYRQKVPKSLPRSLTNAAADALFSALRSHRDRALVAFWLSSGVRASELLSLRHEWIDYGRKTISVISKGSRTLDEVPASADAFVWLALYLADSGQAGTVMSGPVWRTLRRPHQPLSYHAARAVLMRANALLGTNHSLHDLRHTAAIRMANDPHVSLVEVQTILRHASVTTTQVRLKPRLEDLIEKMADLDDRRRAMAARPVSVPSGYNHTELAELLGLPR